MITDRKFMLQKEISQREDDASAVQYSTGWGEGVK